MSSLKKMLPKNKIIPIIAIVVFGVLGIVFFSISFGVTKNRCSETFDTIYQDTRQNTYNEIYQTVFDFYEGQNHVSNIATISIGNIQEENALEVLSVCDSWIKVSPESDDDIRWVEFNATGVYNVDMSRSEIMIDDYNKYVYVKLETPKLCHISVDTDAKVYLYKYNTSLLKWNGNYEAGTNEYLSDRSEALDVLTEMLERNDENLDKAKKSAESLIRTFIINVNPNLKLNDSNISIEWI